MYGTKKEGELKSLLVRFSFKKMRNMFVNNLKLKLFLKLNT